MLEREDLDRLYDHVRILRRTKRLDVCDLLKQKGPMTVNDVAYELNKSKSETSQIFQDLRQVDIVEHTKVSRKVYYELNQTKYQAWKDLSKT